MSRAPERASAAGTQVSPRGSVLGIPMGDLGWFSSLLMAVAAGFGTFFAGTFFGIVAILFANSAGHRSLDYALSYRRVGFPAGVLVLVLALGYLGFLWTRRTLRGR